MISSKSLPSKSSRLASTSYSPCRVVVEEIITEEKADSEFSTRNQQRKSTHTLAESNEDEIKFIGIHRNSNDGGQQHGRSVGAQYSCCIFGRNLITNSNQLCVGSREMPSISCYGHGSSVSSTMKRQKVQNKRISLPANSSANTMLILTSRTSLNLSSRSVFENRIAEPVTENPSISCYDHGSSVSFTMKRQKVRDKRSSLLDNSSANTMPTSPLRNSVNLSLISVFETA